MPEPERKYPCQYLPGKLEGALSDNQERARIRKFEKVRLVEQHGGRTRGDAQLDRGMQESILVPSSASDVSAAPVDRTKKVWLVEQQGGRTRGDARLDRGMQESILVPNSASDVGAAPADQTKEEQLVEQQGGRTRGDTQLDRGMPKTILVPSSASDVSAASTDLYMAKQFEGIKINGGDIGHWWWKHHRQKLGMEQPKKIQVEVSPPMSSRCHWPPDDYG